MHVPSRVCLLFASTVPYHAPRIDCSAYGDDTFFIRVTSGDVEKHKTLRFNLEKQTVEVEDRA